MKAYPTSVTTAQHDSFIGEANPRRGVTCGRPFATSATVRGTAVVKEYAGACGYRERRAGAAAFCTTVRSLFRQAQLGTANGVLYRLVPEVGLQDARVVALIGERIAAGVA